MDQKIINQNENNDRKYETTIGIYDKMQFKKKNSDNIEELSEFTETPPNENIEYFTE